MESVKRYKGPNCFLIQWLDNRASNRRQVPQGHITYLHLTLSTKKKESYFRLSLSYYLCSLPTVGKLSIAFRLNRLFYKAQRKHDFKILFPFISLYKSWLFCSFDLFNYHDLFFVKWLHFISGHILKIFFRYFLFK